MRRDGIPNTFVVATTLCLVCSLLVAGTSIGLRELQKRNAEQFRKRNILDVAGFTEEEIERAGGIEALFSARIEDQIVDLRTGELAADRVADILEVSTGEVYAAFDAIKASKDVSRPQLSTRLTSQQDIAGLKSRENFAHVYLLKDDQGNVEKYIFPVRGLGLWSILKGFLALQSDLNSVAGISFYEHAETPGLGGEVDSMRFKESFRPESGKELFNEQGEVVLRLVKGSGIGEHQIDGLSGATITSNGVTNMLEFWFGPNGFGPYIDRVRGKSVSAAAGRGE